MHRSVKHKDEIIARCEKWIVKDPESRKGQWSKAFPGEGALHVEIGSGKGQFITGLAAQNPSKNFIAIEGGDKIFVRLLQKAEQAGAENLLLIPQYVSNLEAIFSPGEVSGIYLNFCDPWPKDRHAKRRLTHRNMLRQYRLITKDDSLLALKTDNQKLFDFSMEEFSKIGLNVLAVSRDLHHCAHAVGNITTEYEDKFAADGCPIFYALVAL